MDVTLRTRILTGIEEKLQFASRRFTQEEGGYLIGRFDGSVVEVLEFSHDLHAERSPGSIRFREEHLDAITDRLARAGVPGLYIVGTWHIHPPGYGSHFSSVDTETLFLEHSALRAGGLDTARLPQLHLIMSWGEPATYQVFTLKVDIPWLRVEVVEPETEHLETIRAALAQKKCSGLLTHSATEQAEAQDYDAPSIAAALQTHNLDGFFKIFRYSAIHPEVEVIYIANFAHHVCQNYFGVRRGARDKAAQFHSRYYRITCPGDELKVEAFSLTLPFRRQPTTHRFERATVREVATVILTNSEVADEPPVDLGLPVSASIGEVGHFLQHRRRLDAPPIISSIRPEAELDRWRRVTVVDEFGEVVLPEETSIGTLDTVRQSGVLRLNWRSPSQHPETVYHLRTHRLRGLGYDLDQLKNARVVIAGVGLLGCEVSTLFTACGIGNLVLLDQGTVDFANIYRQRLYEKNDVYQPKVSVACRRLAGSGVKVTGHRVSIPTVSTSSIDCGPALKALDGYLENADLVVGALDCFSGRAVLQALCLRRRIPFLSLALDVVNVRAQALGNLYLSMPGRPACYACGRRLKPALDSGSCTVAPAEFAPIVGSLGVTLGLDVLHHRVGNAQAIQVYSDLQVETQIIGGADEECQICGPAGVGSEDEETLYSNLAKWLGS